MNVCCQAQNTPKTSTWGRRCREFAAWVFPSTLLVLMPKCPACIVTYVAVWTGLGLPLASAAWLRWTLLLLCGASLLFLALKGTGRFVVANLLPPDGSANHSG